MRLSLFIKFMPQKYLKKGYSETIYWRWSWILDRSMGGQISQTNNTGRHTSVWIWKGLCETCVCVCILTLRGCTTTVSFCVCLSVCPDGCLHEAQPHNTQTLCCISPTAAARYLHRNVPPLTSPREGERLCLRWQNTKPVVAFWPQKHKTKPKTFLHFP